MQKFPYEKLKKIDKDGARQYIIEGSNPVNSVTTILSQTANKKHLKEWAERIGSEEANRITTESANLGTLVHDHLECYLLEKDRPKGTNLIRKMARMMSEKIISEGLSNLNEIWGIEETLYATDLYAGTADLIGIYKGKPAIIDFKNTIKMKKEEWIDDYKCQVIAYALAHNEMFNTDINQGVILMIARNLEFKEFVITEHDFDKYARIWGDRLSSFLTCLG